MKKSSGAEEIFKDFPDKIKSEIFAAAEGKLVYFPKNQNKKQAIDKKEVLMRYAQSEKSYSQIGNELGISKVRVFQIVKQERQEFSKEKIGYWKKQGLSLREITKLFKKSHGNVKQSVKS
jgi:predicted DNA-binding protein YlxM (UPF0122 family)